MCSFGLSFGPEMASSIMRIILFVPSGSPQLLLANTGLFLRRFTTPQIPPLVAGLFFPVRHVVPQSSTPLRFLLSRWERLPLLRHRLLSNAPIAGFTCALRFFLGGTQCPFLFSISMTPFSTPPLPFVHCFGSAVSPQSPLP